ncbi:MAG: class I SAM-dependent methyltransferase [Nitrospirota bacterium]
MSSERFQSHLAEANSIEQALDGAAKRVETLDPRRFETKYGFGLEPLMEQVRAEFGTACGLRFEEPRAFLRSLAEEAAKSEVGRFLLCARGLNWRITDLLFDADYHATLRREEREGALCLFDKLAFFTFPLFLATQERARLHQRHTQPLLRDGAVLASLPCGRMRDLLALDFGRLTTGARLVGIDKDPEALKGAQAFADLLSAGRPPHVVVELREGDALAPGFSKPPVREEFDLLTSSGLNIYLTNEQCERFYRHVYGALKPGGVFVTGHVVPHTEYVWRRINLTHWRLQAVVLTVLVGALWESLVKPREVVKGQLEAAGFRDVQTVPDTQGIFPTFVSKKPR